MSDLAGHRSAGHHAGDPAAVSHARRGGAATSHTRPTRRWWPWLRLVAVLAILVALISLLGTKAFAAGLHVLSPGAVLAALGIGLLTTVLNALRWRAVARRVGLELQLGDAIAETYRAIFLNAVLPGGVLGDVDRAVRHGRSSGDVGRGARAVAIERTAGQLVLIAAAVVLITAEPAMVVGVLSHASRAPLIAIAVVLVLSLVVGGLLVVRGRRSAHRGRWRRMLGDTAADVRAGVLSRTAWPLLILLSAAALAGYLVLFLVAARSAGATAPILALLPPLLLALMAMGLPISIGGWGPREGVAALGFWMAGLGAPLGRHDLRRVRGAGPDLEPARSRGAARASGRPYPGAVRPRRGDDRPDPGAGTARGSAAWDPAARGPAVRSPAVRGPAVRGPASTPARWAVDCCPRRDPGGASGAATRSVRASAGSPPHCRAQRDRLTSARPRIADRRDDPLAIR